MTKRQIIKKIKSADWYRQGGAIVPYFPSIPYRAAFYYFDGFNFYKGQNNYGYFDKSKQKKFFLQLLKKQLNNKLYLNQKLITAWRKLKKQKDELLKKINPQYLATLADKELLRFHNQINQALFKLWERSICLEASDPWSDIVLRKYLKLHGKDNIKPEHLALLCGPEKPRHLQREKLSEIKIAIKIKQKKNSEKDIAKHQKEYDWLGTNWAGVKLLSFDYFKKQINQTAKKSMNILIKEKNKLLFWQRKRQKQIKTLQKKLKLPTELKILFGLFSTLSDWREERKKDAMTTLVPLDKIIDEFSRRTKLSKKLLFFLDGKEFTDIKSIEKQKNELQKRTKACFYFVTKKGKLTAFTDKKAVSLHRLLENSLIHSKTLTGSVAYKGTAKGRIKIVISKEDFKKVRQGDILVTQMTRPEFMPILRKAAAIITDEGGITCHAAIISRELKIPCVIGTQIATKLLKDGDLVEVDANRGIVKIIKKWT